MSAQQGISRVMHRLAVLSSVYTENKSIQTKKKEENECNCKQLQTCSVASPGLNYSVAEGEHSPVWNVERPTGCIDLIYEVIS